MSLHLHELNGCAPAPLAHYLKALGILRIVAEQKDREARGFWRNEQFYLLTTLEREELERFFLEEYAPTPFVSPWNKGSGFYNESDPALVPLENSKAVRFERFRSGIAAGRAELAAIREADATVRALKDRTKAKKGMSAAEKHAAHSLRDDPEYRRELAAAERRFKQLKADLFTPYLLTWRGPHRAWMDAALVWLPDGRPAWPSLLGTGGNDGRLDFTNNAMQRIGELFDLASEDGAPNAGTRELLEEALWAARSDKLIRAAIGQFLPGRGGGANSTTGADGDSLINPWDFVLTLEGAVLFSARTTRRLDPNAASQASAPFAVRSHAAGHGTRGLEKDERGEQWMPLWSQPSSVGSIESLLGEARVQLSRGTAHRPIDVARAVARLGVARGVSEFARFGYLERNGQSKIAVPLGRIEVRHRPRGLLVDDIAPWLDKVTRLTRGDHATARLRQIEGALADAVFAVLTHDDAPARWQAVLLAASEVEVLQSGGTAIAAGPIPPLSPEWLQAADDGSVEWRLACALGSAAASYGHSGRPVDPVRHHWLPLKPGAQRFLENDKRLQHDSRVVITGRDPVADLASVVERRLLESVGRGQRRLPLVARYGFEAHASDLADVISGHVDLERVSSLARALMAIRWAETRPDLAPRRPRVRLPDEAWIALRLACLPWPWEDGRNVAPDAAMVRRLIAGDGASAVEIALRRLRAAGIRPPLTAACTDVNSARLWGAALAFPISHRTAKTMARSFAPNQKEIR